MIPGSANPLLMAAAQDTAYTVSRSLRFNSSDSAYLSRTPSSAGNRKTWTWSGWVKRSEIGPSGGYNLFSRQTANNDASTFYVSFVGDRLIAATYNSRWFETTQLFRDPSAWYHIVVALDTTQAVASDRLKAYVNGLLITQYAVDGRGGISQNADLPWNDAALSEIGRVSAAVASYFSGYLAEIHFVDGQALTPSSFTEVSATTGQLIPKAYTGSYGTNGFKLDFADNSAATAAALGKDTSGNGNNWTPTNLFVTSSTRSYTGTADNAGLRWANLFDGIATEATSVISGTSGSVNATFTLTTPISLSGITKIRVFANNDKRDLAINGISLNTPIPAGQTGWFDITSTLSGQTQITSFTAGIQSGVSASWFSAIELNDIILVDQNNPGIDSLVDTPTSYGTDTSVGGEVRGNYATLNPISPLSSGATLSNGNLDVVTVSSGDQTIPSTIFVSSGKWFCEFTVTTANSCSVGIIPSVYPAAVEPGNTTDSYGYRSNANKRTNSTNTSYGATFTNGDVIGIALDLDNGTLVFYKNGVSQGTAFTGVAGTFCFAWGDITGGGTTSCSANFGQRPFAYPVSGFKALCDTNLPTPVVAKPSTVFDTKLYTGNGSTQSITGLGFSPDLVWIKTRSIGYYNVLYDTVRGTGTGKALYSNTTDAEGADSTLQNLTAFNSDGFSLGTTSGTNILNDSNQTRVAWMWDAGSSNSTNTQGSITSTVRANASAGFSIIDFSATDGTVGHGLGVAPEFFIYKARGSASNWSVYHKSLGNGKRLLLNTTGAEQTSSIFWNNTSPTSSVITLGSNFFGGGSSIIYAFAPVAGYSSFGQFIGNGDANGPFVYTGFRPRWVMIKPLYQYDGGGSTVASTAWYIYDSARGPYNANGAILGANNSYAEENNATDIDFLSNGFKLRNTRAINTSNGAIYAAFAEAPFQYARAR